MTKQTIIECDQNGIGKALSFVLDDVSAMLVDVDFTPMLNEYMTDLENAHLDFFIGEHDPLGNAWPPLAPSTVAAKGHDSILFDTHAMMNSLGGNTSDSIKLVFREGDGAYLVFGTSTEYAMFHQRGTAKMPARPFVGMNEELIQKLQKAAADAAVDALIRGAF